MTSSPICPPATVIRRVGGLEGKRAGLPHSRFVIRRVGGLEGGAVHVDGVPEVIRRVGGLEVIRSRSIRST